MKRIFALVVVAAFIASGCSLTFKGFKQDVKHNYNYLQSLCKDKKTGKNICPPAYQSVPEAR